MASQQQVVLEVAAQLMAQQWGHILYQFHVHVAGLEDVFFQAQEAHWEEFNLSCALAAPTIPIGATEGQTMEAKLMQVIDHYRTTCEGEIMRFNDASFRMQQDLSTTLYSLQADAKAAERKRADELVAAQQLARREVAATVALVKTEQAQSATEVSAMQRLQDAVADLTADRAALQDEVQTLRADNHARLAELRKEMEVERAEHRTAVEAERDSVKAQIKRVMCEADKNRQAHMEELAAANVQHGEVVDRLRAELATYRNQAEQAQREADEAHRQRLEERRVSANERLELNKTIAALEFDNERLRLMVDTERNESSTSAIELRRSLEARKTAEVEDFKRRLISAVSNPASPSGGALGSARTQTDSAPTSYRGPSPGMPASPPRTHRGASTGSAFSPPSLHMRASTSPTYRASSTMDVADSSRSPSATFVRLQALSAQWKDRIDKM